MRQERVPVLIVVDKRGVPEVYEPPHAHTIIVDLDDVERGAGLFEIPRNCGFEDYVKRAKLKENKDFVWKDPVWKET